MIEVRLAIENPTDRVGAIAGSARVRMVTYYGSWVVVVSALSSFALLPINYTIGLVLIAIVALIFINAFGHRLVSLFRTHKERDERVQQESRVGGVGRQVLRKLTESPHAQETHHAELPHATHRQRTRTHTRSTSFFSR